MLLPSAYLQQIFKISTNTENQGTIMFYILLKNYVTINPDAQLPLFEWRSRLYSEGKGEVQSKHLGNYLQCLLCFGCGDIGTTMKTLLKQEDTGS